MSKRDRLLERVLGGRSDANIDFGELCRLLELLGYAKRKSRGGTSHVIYRMAGQREIINLQPRKYGKAKPYQVEQVRAILMKYGITQVP